MPDKCAAYKERARIAGASGNGARGLAGARGWQDRPRADGWQIGQGEGRNAGEGLG